MPGSHNSIIAAAAKAELVPLGFRQKGRSRLWLADHGSWLNVVEFTPSRWSKGVHLMNAAHWLWAGTGFMSFDQAVASNCHAEFESEDQFRAETMAIAQAAAEKAKVIEEKFRSIETIRQLVVDEARKSEMMRPSWFGYYAGIVSGLQNRMDDAEYFLGGITDKRVVKHAFPLLSLVKNSDGFKRAVNERVALQRAALQLPRLDHDAF